MSENDELGKVVCQICKQPFSIITVLHLKKHNITLEAYKATYPDAKISSNAFKATQQFRHTKMFSPPKAIDTNTQQDEISDEIIDLVHEVKPSTYQPKVVSKIIEKVETPITYDSGEFYGIHPDKVKIILYLRSLFSNVKNNYIFDKFTLGGHLEYQIVMDIAILSKNIDFEFPNTFWHNPGYLDKQYREPRLISDGWTVITILSNSPSLSEIEFQLRDLKLIK